ncbi:MAG: NapC/NirT family cytochrome c, partial [Nevskia sp.]|nr:NapC/NirT family cytochrome c [Nevskia sp.]
TVEHTSELEFCVSCHSMQVPYQEYQASPHFMNASGVRATCSDCHVPRSPIPKLWAKALAANDVVQEVLGTIDTPEKYESNRLRMAKIVWARMEETDSRECRSCHTQSAMDVHKQTKPNVDQMTKGLAEGQTCINCHKGISHHLPDMASGYKATAADLSAAAEQEGAKADTVYTLGVAAFWLDKPASQDADPDGKLLPVAGLKVLSRDGDLMRAKVSGWVQEGAERLMYAERGQRVMVAALAGETADKLEKGTPEVDNDTGLTWTPVTLSVWTSRHGVYSNLKALWAYGNEMYSTVCGSCHGLPPTDQFLANQWIGTLSDMKGNVALDDTEYRFLLRYLQAHAGK